MKLKNYYFLVLLLIALPFAGNAQNYVSIFYFPIFGDGFVHPSNLSPTGDNWIMQGQQPAYSNTFGTLNYWGKPYWADTHGDKTIKNNYRFYLNGDFNQPNQDLLDWHADLLTDAGVDFIVLDITNDSQDWGPNGPYYMSVSKAICKAWEHRLALGQKIPQIVFFCANYKGLEILEREIMNVYDPRLFFNYEGKKMVLVADPSEDTEVNDRANSNDPAEPTWGIFGRYTARHCWFNPNGAYWSFKDIRKKDEPFPAPYMHNGEAEQLAVSVAVAGFDRDQLMPGAYGRENGYWFNRYMDHAENIRPKFLFIFSWNEWVAGNWADNEDRAQRPYFVDQYLTEYSSDMEPMAGGHGFQYYELLRKRVRQYKKMPYNQAIQSGNVYQLTGRMSRKELTADAGNIVQSKGLKTDNQRWLINAVDNGYYTIGTENSWQVIEVVNASLDNAANVQLGNYTGGTHQQWSISYLAEGYFSIVNRQSGKSFDVTNFSLDNGANVIQYESLTTENQQWEIRNLGLAPGTGDGLKAQYFNGMNFETPVLNRIDPTIDFNWVAGSPDPAINVDGFSAVWTGEIEPRFSEIYTFYINSDNGRKLWIDNQLIIDRWTADWGTVYSGTIALSAGTKTHHSYGIL